ncbi:hypothetical protein AX15_003860, partial [Amanita polypyramis BW_CC]
MKSTTTCFLPNGRHIAMVRGGSKGKVSEVHENDEGPEKMLSKINKAEGPQLNPNAYSELTKTATPQNQTATANAPTHETGTRTSAGPECFKFLTYKLLRNSLLAIFTLGIPSFHQSLAPGEPELGLKAILSIWKAVRFFDGLLVAMVTTVFKPSVQASITFWIFISCSLVQAIMGLICSTILIIYFS